MFGQRNTELNRFSGEIQNRKKFSTISRRLNGV